MNKWEKQFLEWRLDKEKSVLEALKEIYEDALGEIRSRIAALIGSKNADLPRTIRRIEYQRAMQEQVQAVLDKLHANEYETIQDFVDDSYTDGFVGAMYSLHHQGLPLFIPIDRSMVVKAVTLETKLSKPLYQALGVDVKKLGKIIQSEITRGIASGALYDEIIRNLSNAAKIPRERAQTIVRTEAGRVQEEATMEAAKKSQDKGADVVKQWCATLDSRTRKTHRRLDGQVRELDEPFEIDGKQAMYPHGFGRPEEDINCRCTTLIRARAAMDEEELKEMQERAKYFGLDKTKDFEEFKKKYLDATKEK